MNCWSIGAEAEEAAVAEDSEPTDLFSADDIKIPDSGEGTEIFEGGEAATEIGEEANRLGEALTTVLEATTEGVQSPFFMLPGWVPIPRNIRNKRGARQLDEIIMRIIDARRGEYEDKGDLLSMLLLAEDEDGNRMTDKQLRDEVITDR